MQGLVTVVLVILAGICLFVGINTTVHVVFLLGMAFLAAAVLYSVAGGVGVPSQGEHH